MSDEELKYLKVDGKKWAGYTGVLGMVRFKDGQSTEMLPRWQRDKMAAAMPFLEVDKDGNEQPAGAHHRLIRERKARAPIIEPLKTQSAGEKAAELEAAKIATAKVPTVFARADLEALTEKGGMKALREVAKKWNVKHRSIPTLIEMILDAQEKAVAARKKAETPVEPVAEPAPEPAAEPVDPTADPVVPEDVAAADERAAAELKEFEEAEALKAAAATGDLAAAISTEPAPESPATESDLDNPATAE